jgi:hypothetical protein
MQMSRMMIKNKREMEKGKRGRGGRVGEET